MKRFITVWFIMLMVFGVAFAETNQYSDMTDNELAALIDGARNEQTRRILNAEDGNTLLFSESGVSMYLTGKGTVDGGRGQMHLECIIANDTSSDITVCFTDARNAYINSWQVGASSYITVAAGKKAKDNLDFLYLDKIDITNWEEIEDVEFGISVYKKENDSLTGKLIEDQTPLRYIINK